MSAHTVGRTAVALTVVCLLPAESRAQHGGGHGGAGFAGNGAVGVVSGHFGSGVITPNGYGGVNIPAYGVVGGGAGFSGVGGYGYGPGYGYGYGGDPFLGMGMSPMDQQMVKQARLLNMQADAELTATLAQESRVRTMVTEQKASRAEREDCDSPESKRSSRAKASASDEKANDAEVTEPPRPSLEPFVGAGFVRWPVHGFTRSTLASRAEADRALLAVRAEIAAQGTARPTSVARATAALARFRSSARSELPVKSRTIVKLDVFLRGLDQALYSSVADPTDGRLPADR